MMRRTLMLAAGLFAIGCDSAGEDRPQDAPAAEQASRPAPSSGERPEAEAVTAQIFDEVVEPEDPRRVTYHVLVSRDASRDELRETLSGLMAAEAERDSTLVAARAVGYYGVQTSATEADMLAFVWAEWLPVEGWYDATDASRTSIHRVYFYPETPPQW